MNADQIQILNDRLVRLYKDACVNWKVRECAIRFFQLALPYFGKANSSPMAKRNRLRLEALKTLRFAYRPSWQVF